MKIIINANLYDFYEFKKNQYIIFEDNILEVGNMKNLNLEDRIKESNVEVIDAKSAIVMPSLVNCHSHIYSTFSRGANLPFNVKSFKDILDQLWWKLDKELTLNDCFYSALIYGMDCIKNGVTTIIDHHASGADILGSLTELKKGICDELKLRGIFAFECSDRFNIEEAIEENLNFSKKNSENFNSLFGLHASMSLSERTLNKVNKLKKNIPIHIHVSESIEDEKDALNKYNMSVIERLDFHKLLNKNSLLAHCVNINEKDYEILSDKEIYVVLNPTSNLNNAVGIADYHMLKKYKIPCLIGNDGLGANITREFLNLTYLMKNKYKSPMAFTFEDLLEIIRNNYKYVSKTLNVKLGKLQKGYKSDILIIPYDSPTAMEEDNIFAHLFFGIFDNFSPKDVICNGEFLMKDYKLLYENNKIYEKSRVISRKLWNKLK